ncbi:ABC transporter permease subunit [Engelhardtia mirabilis]
MTPALASSFTCVLAFARRELREALTSRWFVLYGLAFAALSVSVSYVSLASAGSEGLAGFGRTAAGLLNLIMLVVPLMALTAGAGSLAGERERGTLIYLVAQPVSRWEVLLGKFLGLAAAFVACLCGGFGLSALVLASRGAVGIDSFVMLVAATSLLALVMLALGFVISVFSRKSSVATGVALFTWLFLVLLSDLGLMAGSVLFKLRVQELFALSVLNPLQAFKLGVVQGLESSLDVLGPVGVYASQTWGERLPWLLFGVLCAWGMLAFAVAAFGFSRSSTA